MRAPRSAPCVLSSREHWSLRRFGADERPPGPTLARIAYEKAAARLGARAGMHGRTYDVADVGLPGGPHRVPMPEWDLWPVRVSRDLPGHRGVAWSAWALLALAAAGSAARLARAQRRQES